MAWHPLRTWALAVDPTGGAPLDDLSVGLPLAGERVRSADGAELDMVIAGDEGPLVVLAHCWTGDRRVWGPVARRLAVLGHRVVLYDHRGHGGSSVGSDGCTLEALAGDLAAVLEHVGARDATVAGHSLGGMTVQALAAAQPSVMAERVAAAVLVATACTPPARGPRARFGPRVVGHRRVESLLARPVVGPLAVRDFVGRRPCLSHLQALTETFRATPGPVRTSLLTAMLGMELTGALAGLGIPVTVVVGSADRHTTPEHGGRIAASVPGSRFVVVPDAGHMLPWEAPDLLARLVADARGPSLPHTAPSLPHTAPSPSPAATRHAPRRIADPTDLRHIADPTDTESERSVR